MKKRISITISDDIVEKLDNVQGSRSRIIDRFLRAYMRHNRYCVILAGGNPSNLRAKETFRPLLNIGKATLIEDMMQKAADAGYWNFIIIGSDSILEEIKKVAGDKPIYITEHITGGTATTLRLCRKYIKDTFLLLPCDHYFDFDLRKLEHVHEAGKFTATLSVYAGARYVWNKSAAVRLDANTIIDYWEKPEGETFLTSTFIGFAEPDIFDYTGHSLQDDVFPKLVKAGKLGGAVLAGNFVNVHSSDDVKIIQRLLR